MVILDENESAIIAFTQHKAVRRVREEDIEVAREEAERIAVRHLRTDEEDAADAVITDTKLVLSHHLAPDNGPLWYVYAKLGSSPSASRKAVIIDAMTGKVLEPMQGERRRR